MTTGDGANIGLELDTIYCGDCLEIMKKLDDNTINLVIADPPYYKIKDEKWDKEWKTFNDYLDFIEKVSLEIKRVLKDNGSFYIFGDDRNIAYIQVRLDKHFTFLNHLIWHKQNNLPIKYAHNHRKFCPVSERILFYSNQHDQTGLETVKLDINNFTSLRQYFHDFQKALGLTIKQINKKLGNRKAEHAFYWGSTQWDLPTQETYQKLCELPLKNEFIRREYEDLRREYEDLRRPYNYQEGTYEVITEPIIQQKENTEHPTTKPPRLIKKLIQASSNTGNTILDPFLGSGTTAVACKQLNRHYIGIEINPEYCKIDEKRLQNTPSKKLEDYI